MKYTQLYIKKKKIHKFTIHKKYNSKSKYTKYIFRIIFMMLMPICIIILIFKFTKIYSLYPQIFNREQYIKDKKIIESLKVCICSIGKLENRYIREYAQHYKKYGVDKIFLYDNNDINGEKFEEVIEDYIKKDLLKFWIGEANFNLRLNLIMIAIKKIIIIMIGFCYSILMNLFIYIIIQI